MKQIPLTKGKFAIVDDGDFEDLNQYKWYYNSNGAASRDKMVKGVRTRYLMHREVLDAPKDLEVDHINGDRLDNRRCNLRLATRSQNVVNRPVRSDSKTKYKGVEYKSDTKRARPYAAYIKKNGKKTTLGHYETASEAHEAFKKASEEVHGEYSHNGWERKI